MYAKIKYSPCTHQHSKQLGNLVILCDDVLGFIFEFLSNNEYYNVIQISNSFLYKLFLEVRYNIFKRKRLNIISKCISTREKNYQFANSVFKKRKCIVSNCNFSNTRLTFFTNNEYYIPYCASCWQDKILPLYEQD